MLANVKNILVGLTYQAAEPPAASALAYALSLAVQAGACPTVQSASPQLAFHRPLISDFAVRLAAAENARPKALAAKAAEYARRAWPADPNPSVAPIIARALRLKAKFGVADV